MNCHVEGCLEPVVKIQKACKFHKNCSHNDGKAYCVRHFILHIVEIMKQFSKKKNK